jgi:hypothetical protein
VALWTNNRIIYDSHLMDGFLILQVTEGWYIISQLLMASANRHKKLAFCRLLSSSLGFCLGYFLGRGGGPAGVVQGLLLADIVTCGWFIPWSACRMLGQAFSRFAATVLLRGLLLLIPVYVVMHLISDGLVGRPGLDRIILSGASLAGMGMILTYLLCLDRAEKTTLRNLVSVLVTSSPGRAA